MSQYDFGDIDPITTSGTDLATMLGEFRDALLSQHSGAARPTYAVPGTIWVNNFTAPWQIYLWDGTHDVLLASVNPDTGRLTLSGVRPYRWRSVAIEDQTVFTEIYYNPLTVVVYLNGNRLDILTYTALDGVTITLNAPCAEGDILLAEWFVA